VCGRLARLRDLGQTSRAPCVSFCLGSWVAMYSRRLDAIQHPSDERGLLDPSDDHGIDERLLFSGQFGKLKTLTWAYRSSL